MCTVLLPPGVNPIAVIKSIISYTFHLSYLANVPPPLPLSPPPTPPLIFLGFNSSDMNSGIRNKGYVIFRLSWYCRVELDVLTQFPTDILTVKALDNDTQIYNSEVYYSVTTGQDVVTVNRTTGVVTLHKPLSGMYKQLAFTISARDGGSPPRIGRTKLTIIIKILSGETFLCLYALCSELCYWLKSFVCVCVYIYIYIYICNFLSEICTLYFFTTVLRRAQHSFSVKF